MLAQILHRMKRGKIPYRRIRLESQVFDNWRYRDEYKDGDYDGSPYFDDDFKPSPTCKQIPETWTPCKMGWGLEHTLNNSLQCKYRVMARCVNEIYAARYCFSQDPEDRQLQKVIDEQVEMLKNMLTGEDEVHVIWQEIEAACGQPNMMPVALATAVADILGPDVTPQSSYPPLCKINFVDRGPFPSPIPDDVLDIPNGLERIKLNCTLHKLYLAMNRLVKEFWVRYKREWLAPPTVTLETEALIVELKNMRELSEAIIGKVRMMGEEPFDFPVKLYNEVKRIAPVRSAPSICFG